VNAVLVQSALYRFVRFRLLRGRQPAPASAAAAGDAAAAQQRYLDEVSRDTVAEYFDVLAALSRRHRFQVLVAVFPRFVRSFGYYRYGDQHAFVQDLARRHGFFLADLLVPYARCREAAPATPISSDYFHPTAYGHRCAASALAGMIGGAIQPRAR
jgi:hypothetical protein